MEDNEQLTRVISEAVANAIRQASNESSGNSSEQLNQVDRFQSNSGDFEIDSVHAPGRPSKNIPREYLENFLSVKTPISEIARLLAVSRPTVYAAIQAYNIPYEGRFSNHSNDELRCSVVAIKLGHPNAGEVMVQGHLRAKGVNVQRNRIRSIIKEVDPRGVETRSSLRIRRRRYSVPCPNYLWHIDGNHKLIRWKFVLHHGIDGFSRLVTFGKFSNNNRASTVLDRFNKAVEKYGQPLKIRTGYGGENVQIWRNMVVVIIT
ncbi:uncharacterized protein LOC124456874 [Xenia sp. Carnegie-2017]|uniref:uncharacterized protein LOC124456874 n=1 Tax=Xenia sp. Carnegie-2017 TaxID=2897299 RepID=UPI001F04FF26|nr:uncharacterized protein LOC124456874 [Xenia sp. Carnegie-2017]